MRTIIRAVRVSEQNNQETDCIKKRSQILKLHLEFNFSFSYTIILILICLNEPEWTSFSFLQPAVRDRL
jgi:hypothetical protein